MTQGFRVCALHLLHSLAEPPSPLELRLLQGPSGHNSPVESSSCLNWLQTSQKLTKEELGWRGPILNASVNCFLASLFPWQVLSNVHNSHLQIRLLTSGPGPIRDHGSAWYDVTLAGAGRGGVHDFMRFYQLWNCFSGSGGCRLRSWPTSWGSCTSEPGRESMACLGAQGDGLGTWSSLSPPGRHTSG